MLPSESCESVSIQTDRNLYLVSEKIYFTVGYHVCNELNSIDWSNVIYVELIRWNGDKLIQGKFVLQKSGPYGYLDIPGDIVSGNYYLRAYTKWMRNYSPENYGYCEVKIVNPYSEDIDENPEISESHTNSDSGKKILEKRSKSIQCSLSKKLFQPGEKAEVNITLDKENSMHPMDFSVTIVRKDCIDTALKYPVCKSLAGTKNNIDYLPEIRGISVTGNVTVKNTNTPLVHADVYLSIPVSGEYFSVYNTDDQGNFLFTLPFITGNHDLFIEALPNDTLEAEIKIDNDYCNVQVNLPYKPFQLTNKERNLVQELMINDQLKQRFISVPSEPPHKKEVNLNNVFYNKPEDVFYTRDYIELNNLEEFIFELIKPITIHHKKGVPYLTVDRDIGLNDLSPLVLLDNLPIKDLKQFLNIPVNRLDRVELINEGYVAGEKIFKGLISVYSKNSDFAGIEIPKNGLFFNYGLYSEHADKTQMITKPSNHPNIPDLRNLLYWDPHITLTPDKTITVSFTTSDCKGEYMVFVRSINGKGTNTIYGTSLFTVK